MKRNFKVMCLIFALSLPVFAHDHDHLNDVDFDQRTTKSSKTGTIEGETVGGLKVNVHTRNFKRSRDRKKLKKAVEILLTVINSERFKEKVLSHKFKGETTFHRNNGLTNQEIYDLMMTGAEVLKPAKDKTMDFDLTLYRSWNPFSKVKGYTKPDTMRIWIHKKFYRRKSWSAINVASNLTHEWLHKVGFGHAFKNNPDRPFTVPYAIGYLVGDVAREMGYK